MTKLTIIANHGEGLYDIKLDFGQKEKKSQIDKADGIIADTNSRIAALTEKVTAKKAEMAVKNAAMNTEIDEGNDAVQSVKGDITEKNNALGVAKFNEQSAKEDYENALVYDDAETIADKKAMWETAKGAVQGLESEIKALRAKMEKTIKEYGDQIKAISDEILKLKIQLDNYNSAITFAKTEKKSAETLKTTINKYPVSRTIEKVWCADYSVDLTSADGPRTGILIDSEYLSSSPLADAEAGTDRRGFPLVIAPSDFGSDRKRRGGFDVKDAGMLVQTPLMYPWQKILARLVQPFHARFHPIYRRGYVKSVNYDKNTCGVELEKTYTTIQNIDITRPPNGAIYGDGENLTDVPVEYMTSDSAVFEEGDHVIVKFKDRDFKQPKVIGFVDHPKPDRNFGFRFGLPDGSPINYWFTYSTSKLDKPFIFKKRNRIPPGEEDREHLRNRIFGGGNNCHVNLNSKTQLSFYGNTGDLARTNEQPWPGSLSAPNRSYHYLQMGFPYYGIFFGGFQVLTLHEPALKAMPINWQNGFLGAGHRLINNQLEIFLVYSGVKYYHSFAYAVEGGTNWFPDFTENYANTGMKIVVISWTKKDGYINRGEIELGEYAGRLSNNFVFNNDCSQAVGLYHRPLLENEYSYTSEGDFTDAILYSDTYNDGDVRIEYNVHELTQHFSRTEHFGAVSAWTYHTGGPTVGTLLVEFSYKYHYVKINIGADSQVSASYEDVPINAHSLVDEIMNVTKTQLEGMVYGLRPPQPPYHDVIFEGVDQEWPRTLTANAAWDKPIACGYNASNELTLLKTRAEFHYSYDEPSRDSGFSEDYSSSEELILGDFHASVSASKTGVKKHLFVDFVDFLNSIVIYETLEGMFITASPSGSIVKHYINNTLIKEENLPHDATIYTTTSGIRRIDDTFFGGMYRILPFQSLYTNVWYQILPEITKYLPTFGFGLGVKIGTGENLDSYRRLLKITDTTVLSFDNIPGSDPANPLDIGDINCV